MIHGDASWLRWLLFIPVLALFGLMFYLDMTSLDKIAEERRSALPRDDKEKPKKYILMLYVIGLLIGIHIIWHAAVSHIINTGIQHVAENGNPMLFWFYLLFWIVATTYIGIVFLRKFFMFLKGRK